jgi:hypothetical protein
VNAHGTPSLLRRERGPTFDGMVYRFAFADRFRRALRHHFAFHVLFGQDEATLFIARGHYEATSET